MQRTERVILLHQLLKANRYGLSSTQLLAELQCSRSTLYRMLCYLRDALGAPLAQEGDPLPRWRYVGPEAGTFELPGLWLDGEELYTLALALQLRSGANAGGLFEDAVGPLLRHLQKQLGAKKAARLGRVRVKRAQARRLRDPNVLRLVADALLDGRQLAFRYTARSTTVETERQVSPQRLTHYRDNWYLTAFDPGPDALRSFALDRIAQPRLLTALATDHLEAELDTHDAGYGMFSGECTVIAVLRFSAHAARWVADEIWHPLQHLEWLPDGSLELSLPFAGQKELLMDVLRYGADAEVIAPPSLRAELRRMLVEALKRYDP